MTTPRITVDDRDVVEALNRLIAIGETPAPALDAVGRVLKTRIQQGFVTSTAPDGTPWAPLKSRVGQPLRNRGHLMNSIDYRVDGNSVEVGTNLSYAPTHHFGAVIEPKPGKFWQSQRPNYRSGSTTTVTQPAKLAFMVNGKLVFAKKVTIPERPFMPEGSLPADWGTDTLEAIAAVVRSRVPGST